MIYEEYDCGEYLDTYNKPTKRTKDNEKQKKDLKRRSEVGKLTHTFWGSLIVTDVMYGD